MSNILVVKDWVDVPVVVSTVLNHFKQAGLTPPQHGEHLSSEGLASLPGLTQLSDVMGWTAGPINAHWGGPRPLANILIGAGLGSLAGRGASYITNAIAPEGVLDKERHRKKMTILGGVLGALPGAYQGYDNIRTGNQLWDSWPHKTASDEYYKEAMNNFDPLINRNHFNNSVLNDPFTPPHIRAATAGVVSAASSVRGSNLVSPWDVARIAISAGSGSMSGLILGRTLGVLAGLSSEQQKNLQNVGWWAGVLKSVVPQALRMQ